MTNHVSRVPCVDDDNIRANTLEGLKDAGFDVLEAHNGDRAMALMLDTDTVDIVFTDVATCGKWDGVDLVEQIRRTHPAMPVLVTSGHAHKLAARHGKLSPPTVFMSKPYSLFLVVKALEKLAGA